MRTDKEKCVEKAQALVDELNAMYGGGFRYLITGADGCFDIRKYGKPTIYICGCIYDDHYLLDAWETETSKSMLYNSGNITMPKPVMILVLDKLLNRKVHPTKQMELF